MLEQDNSERIERFLRKQMSAEENEAFLNDLKNDEQLRDEAQAIALLIKCMKEEQAEDDDDLRATVMKERSRFSFNLCEEEKVFAYRSSPFGRSYRRAEKELPKDFKSKSWLKWSLSIAAALILIFGAVYLWNRQDRQSYTDKLFSQYYSSYNAASVRGMENEKSGELLADLFNKVGTESNLKPVISELQSIYEDIQLQNSEYVQVLDSIEVSAENDTVTDSFSDYENAVAWYLALAYIKDKQVEKAKDLLQQLAQRGDTGASELLRKLR